MLLFRSFPVPASQAEACLNKDVDENFKIQGLTPEAYGRGTGEATVYAIATFLVLTEEREFSYDVVLIPDLIAEISAKTIAKSRAANAAKENAFNVGTSNVPFQCKLLKKEVKAITDPVIDVTTERVSKTLK